MIVVTSDLLLQVGAVAAVAGTGYVVLIRPQLNRLRQQQTFLATLVVGAEVVTSGGLIGRIVNFNDREIDLELAEGVRVRAVRGSIERYAAHPPSRPSSAPGT
jgi:preprotein translocase subunit YajC